MSSPDNLTSYPASIDSMDLGDNDHTYNSAFDSTTSNVDLSLYGTDDPDSDSQRSTSSTARTVQGYDGEESDESVEVHRHVRSGNTSAQLSVPVNNEADDQISLGFHSDTEVDALDISRFSPPTSPTSSDSTQHDSNNSDLEADSETEDPPRSGISKASDVSTMRGSAMAEQQAQLTKVNLAFSKLLEALNKERGDEEIKKLVSKLETTIRAALITIKRYRTRPYKKTQWHNRGGYFQDLPLAYYCLISPKIAKAGWRECKRERQTLERYIDQSKKRIANGELAVEIKGFEKREKKLEGKKALDWRGKGGCLTIFRD